VGLIVLFSLCWEVGKVPCSATFAYGRPFPVIRFYFFSFKSACRGRGPLLVLLSPISIQLAASQRLTSSPSLLFVPLHLRTRVLLWGWEHVPCGVCVRHHFTTLHGILFAPSLFVVRDLRYTCDVASNRLLPLRFFSWFRWDIRVLHVVRFMAFLSPAWRTSPWPACALCCLASASLSPPSSLGLLCPRTAISAHDVVGPVDSAGPTFRRLGHTRYKCPVSPHP